jgi:hypothetical protein
MWAISVYERLIREMSSICLFNLHLHTKDIARLFLARHNIVPMDVEAIADAHEKETRKYVRTQLALPGERGALPLNQASVRAFLVEAFDQMDRQELAALGVTAALKAAHEFIRTKYPEVAAHSADAFVRYCQRLAKRGLLDVRFLIRMVLDGHSEEYITHLKYGRRDELLRAERQDN